MKERGKKQFPEMNPDFCYEKKLYQCHFGYQALKLRIVHYEKLNLKITGGIKSRTKRAKMLELLTFIQFKLYCIQLHLKPGYYGYYILQMINMGVHNVYKEIGDPIGLSASSEWFIVNRNSNTCSLMTIPLGSMVCFELFSSFPP